MNGYSILTIQSFAPVFGLALKFIIFSIAFTNFITFNSEEIKDETFLNKF